MSQAPNSALQLPHNPGPFPAKLAMWKRKWIQISGASFLAFMIGLGAGGTTEPTVAAEAPPAKASAKAESSGASTLAKLKKEADRLKGQVAEARKHEQAAIAQVRAQAQANQRKAVSAAKAQVRAQAKTRQQQAVAAAVSETKADAADDASSPSDTGSGGTDPRFSYCYEANDAGYGSYVQGEDPEYDWYDDNDNDGVVCEF